MIIVQYPNLQDATDKMNSYSELATPQLIIHPPLAMIFTHATLPIYFFVGTDCINNGGINKQSISDDIDLLNFTFEIEGITYPAKFEINVYDDLYTLGYWLLDE